MKTYTEEDIKMAVYEAKIEENIYFLNKAHFMASRKHEQRIEQLMKEYENDSKESVADNSGRSGNKRTGSRANTPDKA